MRNARNLSKFLWIAALFALCTTTYALPPPRPGLVDPLTQRYRTTGQKVPVFPKEVRTYRQSPWKGRIPLGPKRAAAKQGIRPLAVDTSVDNTLTPLVLLIDFDDRPAANPNQSAANVARLYFGTGPADLSVRNYWGEVSYGKFSVTGSGANLNGGSAGTFNGNRWLRAGVDFPTSITSYSQIAGVSVLNIRTLVGDAVTFIQSQGVDLTPYVRASDGIFKAVILVQPGYGQEDTGNPNDPYSHTANLLVNGGEIPVVPSFRITDYTIVPSLQSPLNPANVDPLTDPLVGCGVVVHEMGHLFGLPDLYPASSFGQTTGGFTGVGVFDLMGYGLWGSNLLQRPDTPAHLSAWSKSFLGWVTPELVTIASPRTLRPVEIFGDVDKVYSNTAADPTQYFLVENREVISTLGSWLFDKFLPGAGALIWQIDEYVIGQNLLSNTVNDNAAFRGVYVKEADGDLHLAQPIPGTGTPNDLAQFFGLQADYFLSAGQIFDRTNPSATVNSSPIVDNTFTNHPVDFGQQVSMLGFTRSAANAIDYVVGLSGGGVGGAAWKTYNVASTAPPAYPAGMPGNDILSLAFDSGNNTWMGSSDRGIFRFLGTRFDFLDSTQGLPEASPPATFPLSPIRAMAFESLTGSMWVGTDRGLYKMRDAGSGFRVTDTGHIGGLGIAGNRVPASLAAGANVIRALAIRGGFTNGTQKIDIKYAATPVGLLRIDDLNNDSSLDDVVGVILSGDVTSVAVDDNGTPTALDDIVWVGFADGTFTRSKLPKEGGNSDNDPLSNGDFFVPHPYSLAGFPRITTLSVDSQGRLWIGTDRLGLQVFDLGETLIPPQPNLRDPLRFNPLGNGVAEAYLNTTRGLASDHVTGIAFQAVNTPEVVAWISGVPVPPSADGGASRFDANVANDNTTVVDERVTVFRPEAGVLPQNQTNGPASMYVSSAAADSAGNVWFGTTVSDAQGVSRFGNAGVLSLDSANYVNTTAIATVTLQDDGLNTSDNVVNTWLVQVISAVDAAGFSLTLTETGPNTGVFTGTFGFTNGGTDPDARLISVKSGSEVTVTYVDFNPPGIRTATATWKAVVPFEDGLLIKPLCFITTAAYGSAMAPEVQVFRTFRDRILLAVPGGETLVSLYYRVSPPLADWIAERPGRRFLARCFLVPPFMAANWAVGSTPGEKASTVLVLLVVFLGFRRRWAGGAGRPPVPGDSIH